MPILLICLMLACGFNTLTKTLKPNYFVEVGRFWSVRRWVHFKVCVTIRAGRKSIFQIPESGTRNSRKIGRNTENSFFNNKKKRLLKHCSFFIFSAKFYFKNIKKLEAPQIQSKLYSIIFKTGQQQIVMQEQQFFKILWGQRFAKIIENSFRCWKQALAFSGGCCCTQVTQCQQSNGWKKNCSFLRPKLFQLDGTNFCTLNKVGCNFL